MFHQHQLKKILKAKLPGKFPKMISADAITKFGDCLAEVADAISTEATNGTYQTVTAIDVERGAELVRLKAVRGYLQGKDSLATITSEVDERIKLIGGVKK